MMSEFEKKLTTFLQRNDSKNVKELLDSKEKDDVELNDPQCVKLLLKFKDNLVITATTETIAEWAKSGHNREVLSEKEVLDLLLNLLQSDDYNTLNVIRALGNICYENEAATKILGKDGINKILAVFYELDLNKNLLFLTKMSGLLLNIFITDEELQFIDRNKLLEHISCLLKDCSNISTEESSLFSYLLQIIYTLRVEYDDQLIFSEKLHMKIINILKHSNIPELELICLQILYNTSEEDNVRILLAQSNVCEKIFELIDKYKGLIKDDESRSILKMACDLINNILIEDESMKLLFGQGKGTVYRKCLSWLDSDDEDLLATAVMAVGNFARNDENCIAIVKEGTSKKLLDLLTLYSSSKDSIKILHGLLSTLKNLVVPSSNKSIILEEGLIQKTKPITDMDQDIVIFKLLGTLRLVIDGQDQAAIDLINQESFLEKLVKWYDGTYHLGVKREVSRLLAWLIKSCHSWKSMQVIAQTEGTVSCLVSMFSSEDFIMENESLISLNLLSTAVSQSCELPNVNSAVVDLKSKFEDQLLDAQIAKVLPYIRIFSHSEQMLANLLSLLEKLIESKRLLVSFKENRVLELLKENSKSLTTQNCLYKIEKISSLLSQ